MTLQLQLNLNHGVEPSPDEDEVLTHRLSRVVTKLFARVIRAEEGSDNPYTQDRLDMEALICSVEDFLAACQRAEQEGSSGESVETCSDMPKALIASILDSHGSSTRLLQLMEDLEIHADESALGAVVATCEHELGLSRETVSSRPQTIEVAASPSVSSPSKQPRTPSRDVAILVSKLGSAPAGEEREMALAEIRRYKAAHGDDEIRAHLQQLSGPFREFIEEQLRGNDPSPQKAASATELTEASSVSERIRNLRSRLQVTEAAVQNAVEDKSSPERDTTDLLRTSKTQSPSKLGVPKQSRLAAPIPSRLASPPPSKLPTPTQTRIPAAGSLRERLAARRTEGGTAVAAADSSATMGRAAALRARLEAVKQQSQQQQP